MQNIVGKKSQNIRKPVMAGQFYPNNKQELNAILSLYLMQAKIARRDNNPRIIIAPHAGYQFSGPVAAFAFKGLQNSGYKRAILIGRSHQEYFAGIAVDDNEAWATPLTSTPVDKDFIARLQKTDSEIVFNSFVHQNEHCLEVELPFFKLSWEMISKLSLCFLATTTQPPSLAWLRVWQKLLMKKQWW